MVRRKRHKTYPLCSIRTMWKIKKLHMLRLEIAVSIYQFRSDRLVKSGWKQRTFVQLRSIKIHPEMLGSHSSTLNWIVSFTMELKFVGIVTAISVRSLRTKMWNNWKSRHGVSTVLGNVSNNSGTLSNIIQHKFLPRISKMQRDTLSIEMQQWRQRNEI